MRAALASLLLAGLAGAQAPAPFPPQEGAAMEAALTAWVRAVEAGEATAVAEAGAEVAQAFAELDAALDGGALRHTAAWSELLRAARAAERPDPAREHRAISARMGQPYRLLRPAVPGPLPLLVVVAPAAQAEALVDALPAELAATRLVLQLSFDGLAVEDLPLTGRRRFVDALAEVLRREAVDRDRVALLSAPGGEVPSTVFAALLPHYFQVVALVAPQWIEGWPGSNDLVRRQRLREALLRLPPWLELPGLPAALDPRWIGLPEVPVTQELSRRQVWASWFLDWCRTNFRRGEWGQFEAMDGALAFLAAAPPRVPYPPEVAHTLLDPGAGRAYWLQVQDFEYLEALGTPSRIIARVDREANAVLLSGRGVHAVELYLNDEILDLDRPVELRFEGSTLRRRVQVRRSLTTLLENFARNPDPDALYPAMIRLLDLPADLAE